MRAVISRGSSAARAFQKESRIKGRDRYEEEDKGEKGQGVAFPYPGYDDVIRIS